MIIPFTGETCVHPIDGTVDPMTLDRSTAANRVAMGIVDWAALLFATCIAALAIVGELKVRLVNLLLSSGSHSFDYFVVYMAEQACGVATQDIALCDIAIAHADDQLSRGSRLALTLLGGVRRWVFLPSLVVTALALVRIKGGDALSVCFNTIAILFLTEVTII
jgi:hypothetical protein